MWGSSGSIARLVAVCVTAVLVVGCAPQVGPTTTPSAGSVVEATPGTGGGPVVDCLTDAATCTRALPLVAGAVAGSGWTPQHVWISSGMLAPTVEMLFDPLANFPAQRLPEGGQFAGNAEVAFAETDQHAGLNLVAVGDRITVNLVGYAVPHRDWCSGACPSARADDGPFTLDLVLPHLDWKADEPILGSAILSYAGAEPVAVSGSSALIAFSYAGVGGTRVVEPVWPAVCARREIDPATPLNEALSKSGLWLGPNPMPSSFGRSSGDPMCGCRRERGTSRRSRCSAMAGHVMAAHMRSPRH